MDAVIVVFSSAIALTTLVLSVVFRPQFRSNLSSLIKGLVAFTAVAQITFIYAYLNDFKVAFVILGYLWSAFCVLVMILTILICKRG